ncbi:MAG: 16S rRNA (guanine(966)-N(2))-methyltransferase RsmD [Peptococcaceae bacterium]|nr:16S rRNA (guanine(966)-N(2))-methyltransferase RsmD [Peptococcaceae bacterium]
MRVIAGNWKGRRLKSVKGMQTRPTANKVKGAIFNILSDKVINARVLDLFAGTGSLAIEALSRGAAKAVLVEKNSSAWETIHENLHLLGADEKFALLRMDAFSFLNHNTEEFDLIFLDPPYHQGMINKVLSYLNRRPILHPKGVIIIETASDEEIGQDLFPYEIMIEREYGDTKLWFLQETEEKEEE